MAPLDTVATRGDKHDIKALEMIAAVIGELAAMPDPSTHHDVTRYVKAVSLILNRWWADPGPEHDLVQAVDRLRRTAMHRVGWASDARRILGYE